MGVVFLLTLLVVFTVAAGILLGIRYGLALAQRRAQDIMGKVLDSEYRNEILRSLTPEDREWLDRHLHLGFPENRYRRW